MGMPEEKRFCSKCGTQVVEGAVFCSSCGTPVSATVSPPSAQPSPTPFVQRREKGEKGEKREKEEKGEKGEKGGDRSGSLVGGSILIWLGISLYLSQVNTIPGADWWAYFLSGLGAILILQGIIRRTRSGRPFTGSILGGAILLVIGLTSILGVRDFWPFILVVIGVAVIYSGITARRRSPRP